ncbi:hypothetical protein [Streptomyces sp. NPDC054838]
MAGTSYLHAVRASYDAVAEDQGLSGRSFDAPGRPPSPNACAETGRYAGSRSRSRSGDIADGRLFGLDVYGTTPPYVVAGRPAGAGLAEAARPVREPEGHEKYPQVFLSAREPSA